MQNRSIMLLAGALLISLTLSAIPPAEVQGAPPLLSLAPSSLALSTIPPKLPADNNTYAAVLVSVVDKNGAPTAALTPIQVLLTSSQANVGVISDVVTITGGQTYAVANFTTTNTAGSTSITASSPGMTSATTSVTTVVAVGYPTHLAIFAVPGTVPARASNTGKLILELEDDVGLPAKAISATPISLYSSNTNVVTVATPTAVMGQGEYLLEIGYASSFVPGSAAITASALGFASGTATITVLGSPPLALKLIAEPTQMVTCTSAVTSCTGRLVVALTDLSGNPTRASRDLQVQISSSDLGIINTVETATIQAGNISATASYVVTASAGSATMTASAAGLQSGFTTITTFAPGTVSPTICTSGISTICELSIQAGPNPVLADHRSYSSVVVALEIQPGTPAINVTGATRVTLTSSITGVGDFDQVTFTIPEGQNWAAFTFTSTFQVGSTILTASGQNLLPAQSQLATFGPIPSKVMLQSISANLPADGASHPALELSLVDAFGSPAIAPFDVPVNMSSSQNAIVKVSPVVIPAGQTFTIINVTAGILQGTANVTALESAFTSGYATSSATLSAVIPAPSALTSFIPGGGRVLWPKSSDQTLPLAAVQLQDSAGNPARARVPLNITVSSSNSTIIPKLITVQVGIGQDYLLLPLNPVVPGSTTLTISSPGFTVSTLPVVFMPYPSDEAITGGPASILSNQTAVISVSVTLDGSPLHGASVHWTTGNANGGFTIATPPSTNETSTTSSTTTTTSSTRAAPPPVGSPTVTDTTDKAGSSVVIFKPTKTGVAKISAAITGPGIPNRTLNFTVAVSPPPPSAAAKQGPSLTERLTTYPLVLVPIGGAGGAIAAVILIRRRGGKGGSSDEEFDTSFE